MPSFPDTCVLCNFAAVDALPLLKEYLGDRGRWSESVEDEVVASQGHHPQLEVVFRDAWFPRALAADREGELERVHTFREVRMFGDPLKPREHLGESETFVLLQGRDDLRDSEFLTDDNDAFRVMGGFGITVKHTTDVLRTLVGWNSLTPSEAFDLTLAMENAGRELRVLPKSPADFAA